jgi:aldose 1-epimerase
MRNRQEADALKVISLENQAGTVLKILNFGASIFSLEINGRTNVVMGPKNPEDYLSEAYHRKGKHFGASVGRHAGRISGGGFSIKGEDFAIFAKEGVHLHGGDFGFTYKIWEVNEVRQEEDPSVTLEYLSPDGEEGYPGNLRVKAKYTLRENNVVELEYSAETDKQTIVNLTNHTYFNLNGYGSINEHHLQIGANELLEVHANNVPTGKFLSVEKKGLDFRELKKIGKVELDTVFRLQEKRGAVLLKGDKSGISLQVETNQPAVVIYVPPDLPADWDYTTEIGKERPGICLETQKYPDAPNNDHFPSVILEPEEIYRNITRWKFISGS